MSALAPYRQFLLLAHQPGWRAAASGMTETDAGAYKLDALPGAPGRLAVPGEFAPIAITWTPQTGLAVLDGACQRIELLDPTSPRPRRTLPGVGGRGGDARRFDRAQDIAFLSDGALAVADTRHGAVKLFSPFPHALLAVWGPLGAPTRLAAGGDELVWVLDTKGARVFALDRDGRTHATLLGLTAPTELAAGTAGVLVLDGADLRLFAPPYASAVTLGTVAEATALTFGPGGFVYAGTSTGLVYAFAPSTAGAWRQVGVGVLGEPAAVLRLLWTGGTTLTAMVRAPGASRAELWHIDTEAAFVLHGDFATEELDSSVVGCVWHRIALDADIPPGTSIEVRTEAHDDPGGAAVPDLVPAPIVLGNGVLDCLVQGGPGRYLTLRLTLRGNGAATPTLRSARVWYPRSSWLQYLPACYQEDDESASFLSRFLSIPGTDFDGFDETIDNIAALFDPLSVPAQWFTWLAAWLALPIEPTWTQAQRRAVLKSAYVNYRRRGTVAGLEGIVRDYAGIEARLVEHFRLRQLIVLPDDPAKATATGAGRLWSRDFYRRLQLGIYSQLGTFKLVGEPEPGIEPVAWGANEFSVFFDAEPASSDAARNKVAAAVEREKPAHTLATYRPVYARMRLDVQATLGIDTRVGDVGQAVLGQISTLGYDAILAPSELEHGMRAIGAPVRPRLGVNTRLC